MTEGYFYVCKIHRFETRDPIMAKDHLEFYHKKPGDLV